MSRVGWMIGASACALALGCSGAPGGGAEEHVENSTALTFPLVSIGESGTKYRLGPATFDIREYYGYGSEPITLEVTGAEDSSRVTLSNRGGAYQVTIQPGWQVQRVNPDGTLSPVAATLVSDATRWVQVQPFTYSPVLFDFHLGKTEVDIGIRVEEGIPAGYDGMVVFSNWPYAVQWLDGSADCCYNTVDDAAAAFPNKRLYAKYPY